MTGTSESCAVDGRTCRVYRTGGGTPLVYLHSLFGEFGARPFLDELATGGYQVIAPELPGFGHSEAIPEWAHVDDEIFWLRRLFDALEISSAAVVGASMGGWLAAEFTTWFPERVHSLVLLNPLGLRVEGAPVYDLFHAGPKPTWDQAFRDGFDVHAVAEGDSEEVFLHFLRAGEALARIGWNPFLHNPALRRRLPLITAPTLVLHGDRDGLVPVEHSRSYAAEIPGARLEHIASGHAPALEQPKETAAAVLHHLSATARV